MRLVCCSIVCKHPVLLAHRVVLLGMILDFVAAGGIQLPCLSFGNLDLALLRILVM
jgi:hypothetical protein